MQQTQAQTSFFKKRDQNIFVKNTPWLNMHTHRGRLLKMYEKHLGSDI